MSYPTVIIGIIALLILHPAPALSQESSKPTETPSAFEGFLLSWPDEEGWKAANKQENDKTFFIEVLRRGETFENWTQLGTMASYKRARVQDISTVPEIYHDLFKKRCPDVRLTVHTVEANREHPRVLFSLDCPKFTDGSKSESSVWIVTQGKQAVYVTHRSIREASVPEDLRSKWIEWLKTGEVVTK